MKTITLKNSFHGTEVKVRGDWNDPESAWLNIQAAVYGDRFPATAAKRRLRRVQKALCGVDGCTCGTVR